MQANNPGHITLNNRRLKVQRWQQLPGRIALTVLTNGDQSGSELKTWFAAESVTLEVEGALPLEVRPELTRHTVVGSGPRAVHRIQAMLWLPEATSRDEPLEEQVKRMQLEIRQLWAEIAELKSHRLPAARPKPSGLREGLHSGQTMIESEIDMGEMKDE